MSRIVHFEIPAEKPEQIAGFYKKVLGWDILKWGGPVDYWLVGTGPEDKPGINGGIARKKDRPASGILVTAEVESVDHALDLVIASGGSVVVPKQAIPGVGWQAHFRDPEGNVLGLLQYDPGAK
ncbi:MAG: VOC family protein [Methanomicrobiales archaeon]